MWKNTKNFTIKEKLILWWILFYLCCVFIVIIYVKNYISTDYNERKINNIQADNILVNKIDWIFWTGFVKSYEEKTKYKLYDWYNPNESKKPLAMQSPEIQCSIKDYQIDKKEKTIDWLLSIECCYWVRWPRWWLVKKCDSLTYNIVKNIQ